MCRCVCATTKNAGVSGQSIFSTEKLKAKRSRMKGMKQSTILVIAKPCKCYSVRCIVPLRVDGTFGSDKDFEGNANV